MKLKLLNFVKRHRNEDWKTILLEKYNILVGQDGDLAIFNYLSNANFKKRIVQEARGIILDVVNFKVVCWPFHKFENYFFSWADRINWKSAQFQEKRDGSIVKRYFYNGEWHWATNSKIYAEKVDAPAMFGVTFLDLIHDSVNYAQAEKEFNNPDYTYIFELTTPLNRVVIDYGKEFTLTIIGMRNIITGKEEFYTGDFQKPKMYTFDVSTKVEKHHDDMPKVPFRYRNKKFYAAMDYLSTKNKDGVVDTEGFVIVDKKFHRVKLKSNEYYYKSREIFDHTDGYTIKKEHIINLILTRSDEVIATLCEYPRFKKIIDYYMGEVTHIYAQAIPLIEEGRRLYETNHNRAEVAEMAKQQGIFKGLIFYGIDHPNESIDEFTILEPFLIKHIKTFGQ